MSVLTVPAADFVSSVLAIPRVVAEDFDRLCSPLKEEAARYSNVELENVLALLALARTFNAVSERDVAKTSASALPHRSLRLLVQRALNGISRALIGRARSVSPHACKQGFELGLDMASGTLYVSTAGVVYYDISSLDAEPDDIGYMAYEAFLHLGALCPTLMSHDFYELDNFPMYAEALDEYGLLVSAGAADSVAKAEEYIIGHENEFEVFHQMGGVDEMLELMALAEAGPPAYVRRALSSRRGISQSLRRFSAWKDSYPAEAERPWARWIERALTLVNVLTRQGRAAKRLTGTFVYDGENNYTCLPLPDGLMVSRNTMLENRLATDRHESAMSAGEDFMVFLPLAAKDTPYALEALVSALALYIDGAMITAEQPNTLASHP